jgi:hypothetical protein
MYFPPLRHRLERTHRTNSWGHSVVGQSKTDCSVTVCRTDVTDSLTSGCVESGMFTRPRHSTDTRFKSFSNRRSLYLIVRLPTLTDRHMRRIPYTRRVLSPGCPRKNTPDVGSGTWICHGEIDRIVVVVVGYTRFTSDDGGASCRRTTDL